MPGGPYTIGGRPFAVEGRPVRLTQEKFEECCCDDEEKKWWVTGFVCDGGPANYVLCSAVESVGAPADSVAGPFVDEAPADTWIAANCGECEKVYAWRCVRYTEYGETEIPGECDLTTILWRAQGCEDNAVGPPLPVGFSSFDQCLLFEVIGGGDTEEECVAACGEWD